jgi:hypothetical protein
MTSPSYELQDMVVKRLKAFAGLTALVSDRVYDKVPSAATFPYLSWGPEQDLEEDVDCIEGHAITIQIDGWSRKAGRGEAKQIAEQVRLALHEYETELSVNALVSLAHTSTQYLPDPDGLTIHAVIELQAFIEQP